METHQIMKKLVSSKSINYYLIFPKQRKQNTVFNRIRNTKLMEELK